MARTATRTKRKPKRPATPRTGRPGKCTAQLTAAIADHIRKGVPRERAAALVGVGRTTFYRWMEEGETQARGLHKDFRDAVQGAENELLGKLVGLVVNTAIDPATIADPGTRLRAATYMLSNRFPTEFTSRSEVRHEGKDGGPIQVAADVKVQPVITADVAAQLDAEQLAALAREMLATKG